MSDGAWGRLGIAPTPDQGAIRRAYADALRAMDVDADVAGFAALRQARDTALAWARSQAAQASAPDAPGDPAALPVAVEDERATAAEAADDTPPGTWPHAAPRLDGHADTGTVRAGHDHGHDALVPALPFAPARGPADDQFVVQRPTLAPIVLAGAADAPGVSLGRQQPQTRADHALHDLLLAGPGTEFGLTADDRAAALALLDRLIAQADAGGVDLWSRTEEWLAETLARSWPRAAPLLDRAAQAFGWADRPATTGDSPAVAFLISRLGSQPLVRTAHPPQDALFVALMPEGGSEAPLDGVEEAAALAHLQTLLGEAHMAQVERSEEIETWLADLLAQSWPRSAPLLEPAAQALGWERERGTLNERPVIAFLNARLRGLRFARKVQDKAHPLHKAWAELTRTGTRKGLFVSRRQVRQLIEGVRSNFPELEQHFNPVLVAAWEPQGGSGGGIGRNFGWIAIVLIGLVRLVIAIADYGQDHPASPPQAAYETSAPAAPGQPLNAPFDPAADPLLADVVHQLFGPGMSYADLRKANPNFAGTINANRHLTADPGELAHQGQVVLTQRLLYARAHAGPARLDALARWRLDMLMAAKADGAETCLKVYHWEDLPKGSALTGAALERQQKLARTMLASGEIDAPQPDRYTRSYNIPGPIIAQIIQTTGLPEGAVRRAFNGEGLPATVCTVQIALLKAALNWKGAGRQPILRLL
ncbi:hypothetical protein [Novosphingobium capsulatum]|uniref:hypothetical protein n=1 Tax=Novosphingobium capsulatum TaxID=13688 RepID=UPI000788CB21|nr:hypothetical protein [Novosphingobium capsulatum]WQD93594.1 hypothetical protein U0041_03085 [Novosphingobium capsulatum]